MMPLCPLPQDTIMLFGTIASVGFAKFAYNTAQQSRCYQHINILRRGCSAKVAEHYNLADHVARAVSEITLCPVHGTGDHAVSYGRCHIILAPQSRPRIGITEGLPSLVT